MIAELKELFLQADALCGLVASEYDLLDRRQTFIEFTNALSHAQGAFERVGMPFDDEERAELEMLRDLKARLISFGGDDFTLAPWVDVHKRHKDEPYIGCPFCHPGFVERTKLERAEELSGMVRGALIEAGIGAGADVDQDNRTAMEMVLALLDQVARDEANLRRIATHGLSGLWRGDDCAVCAIATLDGSAAGRDAYNKVDESRTIILDAEGVRRLIESSHEERRDRVSSLVIRLTGAAGMTLKSFELVLRPAEERPA
jgi:predicted  nucleic acid-binding Zn-ribbon protein